MRVAIVGVTGLVGQTFLKVLEERNFPAEELIPIATEKSTGKRIRFRDQSLEVVDVESAFARKPNLVLFSAGAGASPKSADIPLAARRARGTGYGDA